MAKRVVIVGAGLAGCLLAVYLARDGWEVDLRERRGDPRAQGHIGGRSINLALSARGFKALRRAGLEDAMLREAVRMPGRMIHSRTGELAFQPYSRNRSNAIVSVSRSRLNLALLLAAAAEPTVRATFHQRCTHLDAARGIATFVDDRTGTQSTAEADLVVGADGAFSALRDAMHKVEGFDYDQSWLSHGYKELAIPSVAAGPFAPFAMDPAGLHIWPRGGSMMIALPNPEGSFTCTLFWPHTGPGSFKAIADAATARAHFAREYPDALALMPTFDADFAANPVGWMVTVRCRPWSQGRAVLVGDAAHAIVPFFGQGANASFEDCEALTDALRACPNDLPAAIARYETERKRNTDAIARMALENFIEMRDKTAARVFRLRKKAEHLLQAIAPQWFVPRYDMVSFDTIPYADALERSQRQDRVLVALAISMPAAIVALALIAWALAASGASTP